MRSFLDKSSDLFHAFGVISARARDLNHELSAPEIVVLSARAADAARSVNSLLGLPLLSADACARLASPLEIRIRRAAVADAPLIAWKSRGAASESLEVDEVADKVAEMRGGVCEISFSDVWNVSLLVVPPLGAADADPKDKDDAVVVALSQDVRRLIFAVEPAREDGCGRPVALARRVDAKQDRTVTLFTDFADFVKGCAGTRQLDQALAKSGAASIDAKVHFATLDDHLGQEAENTHSLDMELLEQMQYDLRFERAIGFDRTRRQLLDLSLRKYQDAVPAVLKALRAFRADSVAAHRRAASQLASLESYRLRAAANQHVMSFLQTIERLCAGTLDGSPSLNGQTTEEERADAGVEWRDASHRTRDVDLKKWNIGGSASKLYGGQQFERLLSEFRALVLNTTMDDVSHAQVGVACGPLRVGGGPSNVAWAAAELARRAAANAFLPLIDQLCERAVYVLERQLTIAAHVLDNKRKENEAKQAKQAETGALTPAIEQPMGGSGALFGAAAFGAPMSSGVAGDAPLAPEDSALRDINEFPFFTSAVKSYYLDVVYALTERTRAKCLDEFQCTQMVFWNHTGEIDEKKMPSSKRRDDARELTKSVSALAQEVFDQIKQRLADNIVLKCHSTLLVPIADHMYGEIQGKISRLTDQDLEQMFEVKYMRAKLATDEQKLGVVTQRFEKLENELMAAADDFNKTRTLVA